MLAALQTACRRTLSTLRTLEWIGPLLVRISLGLVFVVTGWGKLHDLDNVAQFFASLDIPAPYANAVLVSSIELVGGALLIAGLGTRVAAMLLAGVMAVAIWTAKLPELHGVVDLVTTIEVAYLGSFAWLMFAGAGRASLDHVLRGATPEGDAIARRCYHGASRA